MDVHKASAFQQIDVFPDCKGKIARSAPRIMCQSFCFSLAVPLLIPPPPEQLLLIYGYVKGKGSCSVFYFVIVKVRFKPVLCRKTGVP